MAAAFSAWWLSGRYWTVRDLGDAAIDQGSGILEFRHSLAGKTIPVRGQVTNITTHPTTLGNMSFIELDGYAEIRLLAWGVLDIEVDDSISIDVTFEWSALNGEEYVLSPQLSIPIYEKLPWHEVAITEATWTHGAYLLQEGDGDSSVVISVEYIDEPRPVSEYNCTLKSGSGSPEEWYFLDLTGIDGPELDALESLAQGEGENGIILYTDDNGNGLLDRGDLFTLRNLIRPSADSGMMTYLLTVCGQDESAGQHGLPRFDSYLLITNRGLLRMMEYPTPHAWVASEPLEYGSQYTFQFITESVSWDDVSVSVLEQGASGSWVVHFYPSSSQLTASGEVTVSLGGSVLPSATVFCNVTDVVGNGVINAGDHVTVTCSGSDPFSPVLAYLFIVGYEPTLDALTGYVDIP